jgi:hypothetical protein
MPEVGVLLALVSALGANVAFLCKHRGADRAPAVRFSKPLATAIALFRSKWWTLGWLVGAVAWGFHVVAMSLAPLSLVQAVMAAGLALLVSSAHSAYSVAGLIAFEGAFVALGAYLLLHGSRGRSHAWDGVLLGVAAGLLTGVGNVAIKALTGHASDGVMALISPWALVATAAGVLAFFGLARGLQLGSAVQVIALSSIAANAAAIIGGVLVFGDPVGKDALDIVVRSLAFCAVIAAAALLPAPRTSLPATA